MQPGDAPMVRGTCACGRRFRVRNAQSGRTTACPDCGRVITITQADVNMAQTDLQLVPLQIDLTDAREAQLVDHGELRPAPKGSRVGLTDRVLFDHADAQVTQALRGHSLNWPTGAPPLPPGFLSSAPPSPQQLSFIQDMLASFYFAGHRRNATIILGSAVAASLFTLLLVIPLPIGPFRLLGVFLYAFIAIFLMQFYWSVLRETAAGEDEIPWVAADLDLFDDFLWPSWWLLTIAALCSAPALIVARVLPNEPALIWGALVAGWSFWPVAVMSVALTGSIFSLRPDLLVRCVIGIGPLYLAAWLLTAAVLIGWLAVYFFAGGYMILPLIGPFINLYMGYVLFRMLGLLFRHFRTRLPWRFVA